MTVFADASAVVKLYADEDHAADIRALVGVAVAEITRVEVPAALWRKHRLGDLTSEQSSVLVGDFEADYFGTDQEHPRFVPVTATGSVLDEAARLCGAHALRAYDAIQLASALASRRADPSCDTIAVFDTSLRRAAAVEGMALVPSG